MRALVVALVAVLVAGCGHVETHEAMLRTAEPSTGRRVELYFADQPAPARGYSEIALVQAIGFGTEAHPEALAAALTRRAGALGCDAVVHAYLDQGYARSHAAGVCVKWLDPPTGDVTNDAPLLPEDTLGKRPAVRSRPAPLPRIESLPSAGPSQGGGR